MVSRDRRVTSTKEELENVNGGGGGGKKRKIDA